MFALCWLFLLFFYVSSHLLENGLFILFIMTVLFYDQWFP